MKKCLVCAMLMFMALAAAPLAEAAGIYFSMARYGWNKWADVTQRVNQICRGKSTCTFQVSNGNFGDPDPGEDKFLRVWWIPANRCWKIREGETVTFSQGPFWFYDCKVNGSPCVE